MGRMPSGTILGRGPPVSMTKRRPPDEPTSAMSLTFIPPQPAAYAARSDRSRPRHNPVIVVPCITLTQSSARLRRIQGHASCPEHHSVSPTRVVGESRVSDWATILPQEAFALRFLLFINTDRLGGPRHAEPSAVPRLGVDHRMQYRRKIPVERAAIAFQGPRVLEKKKTKKFFQLQLLGLPNSSCLNRAGRTFDR